MADIIKLAGLVLGGIGLFLLAIGMMTDGLKLAAGPALRKLLSEWSSTPLRGIFTGCLMTAIVQSSSAVTVASLGFVNAGLMNMRQALGIVYGANLGTTMTGWLVALIGFKFHIQSFALPMIGVGMVMRLLRPEGRLPSIGMALVGFGLFFVGIDALKTAFEGLVTAFDISQYTADGIKGIVTFLLIGIVMTALTQSSSASIAMTITAASSGMVGIYAAAAMVIGANVGTTSTAVIASFGATSHAKRVAAAQVLFNAATAIVALLLLPMLFVLIDKVASLLAVEAEPAISLALFHTLFNVLGVLLVYPHNDRLAGFLERHFISHQEVASKPQFLDKTIAQTPVLAVNAIMLEMHAIAKRIATAYRQAMHKEPFSNMAFTQEIDALQRLCEQVSHFIARIERAVLAEDTTSSLARLMKIEQYLVSCTSLLLRVEESVRRRVALSQPELEEQMQKLFSTSCRLYDAEFVDSQNGSERWHASIDQLNAEYRQVKDGLLLAGTRSHIPVEQMSTAIDCLTEVQRISEQWYKALHGLHSLRREQGSTFTTELPAA